MSVITIRPKPEPTPREVSVADLTEVERLAASKIKARTFISTDTGKKTVGYIAQEVIDAMASEGLSAIEYGLVSEGEPHRVDYNAISAFKAG